VITEEQRLDILDSLRVGCALDVAAKGARTTAAACRELAATDAGWAADLADAEREGAALEVTPSPTWADAAAFSAAQDAKPKVDLVAWGNATTHEEAQAAVRTVDVVNPVTGEVTERPAIESDDDDPDLSRLQEIAASYGPGPFGYLQMVNARCEAAKLHPMDPWWVGHFRKFYASGKMIDIGRVGLRGGKSTNVCRALVSDVLYTRRHLEPSQIGVCPIMSAGTKEASDRIDTIMSVLRACGLQDVTGGRAAAEPGQFRKIKGENGAEVIELYDSQGHPVEFRIYPASKHGAVGFTAIAGFCDEVDLWRDKATGANPASEILDLLLFRFTTQPDAHLYIFSATYGTVTSAHMKWVAEGDTPLQYIARLGSKGAQKDYESRLRLVAQAGPDPRLLVGGDAKSPNIPCWVTSPIANIATCYKLSKGDLAKVLLYYGGRPTTETGDLKDCDFEVIGEESRYAEHMAEDRGY
jgi:hypothetical protein